MLQILTSIETIIIPETHSDFLEPLREIEIVFKNRTVRETTAFDREETNDIWFKLSARSKK